MAEITVMSSAGRESWRALADPPGTIRAAGASARSSRAATSRFTTGFWEREPDTWSFEWPHDEIALILAGVADIDTEDAEMLRTQAGDLVTPRGSKGTWHIRETMVKFCAIHQS